MIARCQFVNLFCCNLRQPMKVQFFVRNSIIIGCRKSQAIAKTNEEREKKERKEASKKGRKEGRKNGSGRKLGFSSTIDRYGRRLTSLVILARRCPILPRRRGKGSRDWRTGNRSPELVRAPALRHACSKGVEPSHKSKMEDLTVEVCGENGAYYKVRCVKSTEKSG